MLDLENVEEATHHCIHHYARKHTFNRQPSPLSCHSYIREQEEAEYLWRLRDWTATYVWVTHTVRETQFPRMSPVTVMLVGHVLTDSCQTYSMALGARSCPDTSHTTPPEPP